MTARITPTAVPERETWAWTRDAEPRPTMRAVLARVLKWRGR